MVQSLNKYLTTDGKVFEQEDTAKYHQSIVDLGKQVRELQKEIKQLKVDCPHTEVSVENKMNSYNVSGYNSYGESCIVRTDSYKNGHCLCCNQNFEYHFTDDELTKIVKSW